MHPTGKRDNARDLIRLDARLDAALSETFPASDPIAVGRPTATERPPARGDRSVVADAGKAVARLPAHRRAGPGGKPHGAKVRGS
jgi:hypothetical protein